jgi:Asp-tRNA(Asn)/Glu-tRNA(Gln) amidotransferase A subunit family amidase
MQEFRNQTIHGLRETIATGKTSASELCLKTLELVARQNDELGILTDVLSTTALREADDIDRLVASGERVGMLAGIPVVIKDNIDTVPAVCSAGLPSLSGYRPEFDAAVVKHMREQGAVIIGVAATDSGAFGVVTPNVKNPKYPGKIAGGSSGGPAAAVAAGFCKVAIGTDTGGSIRIPAACCGIVGLKPTFGRVPSIGVRPLSISVDHVGPLALRIADLRTVMEIFPRTGQNDAEQTSLSKKIGIPKAYFADASTEVKCIVEEVAQCCVELGHNVQIVTIPTPDEIIPTHLILSLTEAARFHLGTAERDIAGYPKTAKEGILLGQSYPSHEYASAIDLRRDFVSQINNVFAEVDFLLLPTLPLLPPDIGQNEVAVGTRSMSILRALIRYTAAFDQSGHPALAMPWKVSDKKSVGSIQLVGHLDSDLQLLAFAEEIEKARDAHRSSRRN